MAKLVRVAPGFYVRVDTPQRVAVSEETIKRLPKGKPWLERTIRRALGR